VCVCVLVHRTRLKEPPPTTTASAMTSSASSRDRDDDVTVTSSSSVVAAKREKPQKPAKPTNLWSRDLVSRDHVTSARTASTVGCREPPALSAPVASHDGVGQTSPRGHSEQQALWTTESHVTPPSQQSDEATCRHNSPLPDAEQPTQLTTLSPEYISPSGSIGVSCQNSNVNGEISARQSRPCIEDEQQDEWTGVSTETVSQSPGAVVPSQHSNNVVEVRHGQDSPRCSDNKLAQWTTKSTELVPQSPHVDSGFHDLDESADTTCGQYSPRCNDGEPAAWTEVSRERIEPPVIVDLSPDNVHVRRGSTLRLVALFTAFPPPLITWYRANEPLAPGASVRLSITHTHTHHTAV